MYFQHFPPHLGDLVTHIGDQEIGLYPGVQDMKLFGDRLFKKSIKMYTNNA